MWGFFYFRKAFGIVSDSTLLEKMSSTQQEVHNTLAEQVADGLGSKRYSKWGYITLAASHQWGSPVLNFRAISLQCFYKWAGCRT